MTSIAVIATLDSKAAAAEFTCATLRDLGVTPWLMDLSLKPHDEPAADIGGEELAKLSGTDWSKIGAMDRARAADTMIKGGARALLEKFEAGEISAVIGVGGANGCTVFCAMMRALPPLFPKLMVTPVAATAAVQWYVAESDIAMFPTISDIVMNRFVKSVIENACAAAKGMAEAYERRRDREDDAPSLVGVSTFGNLQKCVDRITVRLEEAGYEVMHFHASGPGGKALENLAAAKALSGVIDLTTSEMIDLINDGVYKPGENRLTSAGAAGLPQVVVPGAIDCTNWWVGECPQRFHGREFYQYNTEILLMRTNGEEMALLGDMFAERLNKAKGPVMVMIPNQGFSQFVDRETSNIDGEIVGSWRKPETDRKFAETLKAKLTAGAVKERDHHINDQAFADACVDEFLEMMSLSDNLLRVFIENEAGSSTKNTYDEETLVFLKSAKVSQPYPYPYGFALDTKSGDGDAVDCFVVTENALQSGEIVECRALHLLEQIEDGEVDHKILCVPAAAASGVDSDAVEAIRAFVMSVFAHIPGKKMQLGALLGKADAEHYVRDCKL